MFLSQLPRKEWELSSGVLSLYISSSPLSNMVPSHMVQTDENNKHTWSVPIGCISLSCSPIGLKLFFSLIGCLTMPLSSNQ